MRENTRCEVDEPISTPTESTHSSSSSPNVRPWLEKKMRPPASSFWASSFMRCQSGVDFRDEDVLAQRLSRSEDRSASIDNSGRAERDSVRHAAGNVGSNDHYFVVPGPCDIDGPA